MNAIDVLLIIAGVGYILARRMIGDIVQVKSLLVLPAVLTVIGLYQLGRLHSLDVESVGFVAVGVVVSLVIGVARGATVYLGRRGDELWMRYRATTVALWVLNFAAKAAIIPVEVAVTGHPVADATHGLLLSIGVGILAESAVVLLRALHRDGTVVWSKADDGGPHTPSPAFDRARDLVRTGAGRRGLVGTVERDW